MIYTAGILHSGFWNLTLDVQLKAQLGQGLARVYRPDHALAMP